MSSLEFDQDGKTDIGISVPWIRDKKAEAFDMRANFAYTPGREKALFYFPLSIPGVDRPLPWPIIIWIPCPYVTVRNDRHLIKAVTMVPKNNEGEKGKPGQERRKELQFPAVGIELLYSPAEGKCLENPL